MASTTTVCRPTTAWSCFTTRQHFHIRPYRPRQVNRQLADWLLWPSDSERYPLICRVSHWYLVFFVWSSRVQQLPRAQHRGLQELHICRKLYPAIISKCHRYPCIRQWLHLSLCMRARLPTNSYWSFCRRPWTRQHTNHQVYQWLLECSSNLHQKSILFILM